MHCLTTNSIVVGFEDTMGPPFTARNFTRLPVGKYDGLASTMALHQILSYLQALVLEVPQCSLHCQCTPQLRAVKSDLLACPQS